MKQRTFQFSDQSLGVFTRYLLAPSVECSYRGSDPDFVPKYSGYLPRNRYHHMEYGTLE